MFSPRPPTTTHDSHLPASSDLQESSLSNSDPDPTAPAATRDNLSASDSSTSSNSTSSDSSSGLNGLAHSCETAITEPEDPDCSPNGGTVQTPSETASTCKTLEEFMVHLAQIIESNSSGSSKYLDLGHIEIHNVQPGTVSELLAEQTHLNLRFSFDACSNTVFIPVPSAPHQSSHEWFEGRFKADLKAVLEAHGLSLKSRGPLQVDLHIQNRLSLYEPDFSFEIFDSSLDNSQPESDSGDSLENASDSEFDLIPSIVAEVAYSEGLSHARKKACGWLYGSSDEVQVVMLVNIVRPSNKNQRLEIQRYHAYLEIWKRKATSTQVMSGDSRTTPTATLEYNGMVIETLYQDSANDLMDLQNTENTITLELKDFVPQRFHDMISDTTFTFEIHSLRREIRDYIKRWISKQRVSIRHEEQRNANQTE